MNLTKKYFYIYLRIIAIAYWIVITVRSLFHPMLSTDGDAYARLGLVLTHSDDAAWLPLYSQMISFVLKFIDGLYFIGPRLIGWISILISSIFIEKIIYKSTKSPLFSVLGLILFLFHPLIFDLSTITLTEPVWSMFVLCGLYFIFYSEKKSLLYLGLIFWSASQGLRFESWLLSPLLLLFLFINQKVNKKNIAVIFILISITPIAWLVYSHFAFHNAFEFLRLKQLNADQHPVPEFGHLNLVLLKWSQLLTQYIIPIPVLFLYFISFFNNQKSKDRLIWIIPIYLFFTLIIQVFVGNMEYFALRYLFIILPTVIISLMTGFSFVYKNNLIKNIIKTCFVIILVVFFGKIYLDKKYPFYSKGIDNSNEIIYICQKIIVGSRGSIRLAYAHTRFDSADDFITYLTQYKTSYFSYNCNEHIELDTKYSSQEAVKWLEQSDYLLKEIDPQNSSCSFLTKDKILVSKTKNFELYRKNDNPNP